MGVSGRPKERRRRWWDSGDSADLSCNSHSSRALILAKIQAHPSRAHLRPALLEALSTLPTEVIEHESTPPNPWECYQRCLSDLPDCSHVLVAQDDAVPCRNFVPAIEQIAEANPDTPVCLFLGGLPGSAAARARRVYGKQRYVPLGAAGFVPLVAVLWPRAKAEEFLLWSETAPGMTRADDGNTAKWMKRARQQFLATVPSLVQHDDGQESVKGGRAHVPWQESWRSALLLAEDALDYDWLRPQ